jgi:hypothetical protein
MTEQATEILSLHFRNRRAEESSTKQAYVESWIAYQRGALSADEFLRKLEDEFLHNWSEWNPGSQQAKWRRSSNLQMSIGHYVFAPTRIDQVKRRP